MGKQFSLNARALAGGGALALLLGTGCDQPEPKCSVARGDFAAVYTLVSGSGECAQLKGEILSVQSYSARRSTRDARPDPDKTSIGIQPGSITDLLFTRDTSAANPGDQPYALGAFDSAHPRADGFCAAPELSAARLRLPDAPEQMDMCVTTPAQPSVDIQYEFSNVRVYVSASDYGTQLAADLVYTLDGCTATYRVRAVYPVVPCGVALEPPAAEPPPEEPLDAGADDAGDAEPDAACPPEEPAADPGEQVPDDSLCTAVPDFASGNYVGSGLNPDLDVACDPDLLLCVLNTEPPARR
jgi:hypothetical protein